MATESAHPVRATHSIPDTGDLARAVLADYPFGKVTDVLLHRRGLSDVYTAVCDDRLHVLRVYRHGWRTDSDIRWEADLLHHLASAGVPVSVTVRTRDDEPFIRLAAPEGGRQLMVLTFAEGRLLREGSSKGSAISVAEYAEAYGALAARIHTAADAFRSSHHRFELDLDHLLYRPLRAAEPLLAHRPADLDRLRAMLELIESRLKEVVAELDWGPCHGDLTGSNAVVDQDALTMFDFDSGGPGWRAYDLGVFAWSTSLQRRSPDDVDRFLRGYTDVRPLPETARAAVPLFAAAREIWFIGLQTENAPDWGYGLAGDDFLTLRLNFLQNLVEPLG
ncbi:phosphotransferase [Spirillospora sp. NBC_00431]